MTLLAGLVRVGIWRCASIAGASASGGAEVVEGYPLETNGSGLLLTGSIGVGKTHLAVGS